MPNEPTILSDDQVRELNEKIKTLRHDVNNRLAAITTAAELIQRHPETAGRMLATLLEQPHKISGAIAQFTLDFEAVLQTEKT